MDCAFCIDGRGVAADDCLIGADGKRLLTWMEDRGVRCLSEAMTASKSGCASGSSTCSHSEGKTFLPCVPLTLSIGVVMRGLPKGGDGEAVVEGKGDEVRLLSLLVGYSLSMLRGRRGAGYENKGREEDYYDLGFVQMRMTLSSPLISFVSFYPPLCARFSKRGTALPQSRVITKPARVSKSASLSPTVVPASH